MQTKNILMASLLFTSTACATTNLSGTEPGTSDAYTNYSGHPDGDDHYQNHRNPWPGQNTIAFTNYSTTEPVRAPAPTATLAQPTPVRTAQPTLATTIKHAKLEGLRIKIDERIVFESWSANIAPESLTILDEVAALMNAHPHIQVVEIQGHTARTGQKSAMYDLSTRRAQAVRRYLIDKSVAADRLTSKGFGEDRPLARTHQEADRRVEFHVVKQEEVALR